MLKVLVVGLKTYVSGLVSERFYWENSNRNSHERYVAFHRLPNYMNLARDHGTFRARVGLPP